MKNTKLILHRCGLFFMLFTIGVLLVVDSEKNGLQYSYTFGHAVSIFLWGLFIGATFVIFDIKKIPSFVARIIHFVLNGVATAIWVIAVQTTVKSNIFQIVFFAIFLFVVIYWVLHFLNLGANKLFKKLFSEADRK